MNTLRDYVNWGITHCDKTASAEGVPLVMENCKKNRRMKQLEVYGESVQNGTPTPEAPVEVESVGEKCTKNIFNKDDAEVSGSLNTSAASFEATTTGIKCNVITPGSANNVVVEFAKASDFAGMWLSFSSTDYYSRSTAITIRDSSGYANVKNGTNFESNGNGLYYSKIYVDEGVYTDETLCLRLYGNVRTEVLEYSNIMVSVGEVPEKYEPYGKYKVPVVVRGKNLFMPTVVSVTSQVNNPTTQNNYGTTIDSVDLTDNSVTVAQVAKPDYTADNYINGYFSIKTDGLEIGKTYKVSFDVDIKENPLNASRIMVLPSGQYPVGWGGFTESTQRVSCTFTHKIHPDGRLPYLEIRCMGMSFTASNFMITEEGQDDTFEPYVEPVTTNVYLNEPLRKIGDYADVIDFKARKVIINIYENDFSDINTSSLYNFDTFNPSSELVAFRIAYKGAKSKYAMASANVKGNAYCNMYPIVSSSKRAEDTLSGGATNSATFDFIDSNYTTQEAWIAHINELTANGTPLKVIHTLKTSYEEAITCELPTLNAKTTVIDIDTSILPSNIKGKYIKR